MAGLDPSKIHTTISVLISSFELLGKVVNLGKRVARGFSNEGVYEVLNYETTVEILDPEGRKAKIDKKETIRFLQDGIAAIEDEAWGDGKYLIDYKVSPGRLADTYRLGYRSVVLISLREVKNKGDIDTFNISWRMENGFLRKNEQWETKVNHRTRQLQIAIVLPRNRAPKRAHLVEVHKKLSRPLKTSKQLADGRWIISAEIDRPQLFENYMIKWDW